MKPRIIDWIETQFYNIKIGIKNFWLWGKVIYLDRWWDHVFFYTIIRHKLVLMEEGFRKHGHHVGKNRSADKMKVCINLLDRLIEDEYEERALAEHDKKWGEISLDWIKTEDPELFELKVRRSKMNKEDKEEERKGFLRGMDVANRQRSSDLDYLFAIIRKYIQGWWD